MAEGRAVAEGRELSDTPRPGPPASIHSELRADCARCAGLCCVASGFLVSADFAIDKPAGLPCPNLGHDFRCGIHEHLRGSGFPGCAVYDCFGAGQKVTETSFRGRDWRSDPGDAAQMFAVFGVMRQLHELLWHVREALRLTPSGDLHAVLSIAYTEIERVTLESPEQLADLDVAARREAVIPLLRRASQQLRADAPHRSDHTTADLVGADLVGADLAGADLVRADLRGACLRGASLLGANLHDADLRSADLTGADMRGADLAGADLSNSLFLTQSQLDAATGDDRTRLPSLLTRPGHWPTRKETR